MNISKRKCIVGLIAIALGLFLFGLASGRENPPKTGQEHELDLRSVPLPPGAIELKREFRFPEADSQREGPYLTQPECMALNPSGLIYLCDSRNDEVYVFDQAGRHIRTFGRTGQGPGEFLRPITIACAGGKIIVGEAGSMRLQFFDSVGKYEGGFKSTRGYNSIAVANDSIFAAPWLHSQFLGTREPYLIDALDFGGRVLKSFGTPLDVSKDHFGLLNQIILSAGPANNLWVAFKCFPVVRRYSRDGMLLGEFHYRYDIADKKEAVNKKIDSERAAYPGQSFYQWVCQATYATGNGIYLIDSAIDHRFLIVFMKADGQVSEYYWAPIEARGFVCGGIYVIDARGGRKFYILNGGDACVDVYSVRRSRLALQVP